MEKQMKNFKNFGIKSEPTTFIGDKIQIKKVLGKEIIVEKYDIRNSKHSDFKNDKCLWLQIILNEEKRVIFTGSLYLMEMIQQVNKDDYPFKTTIVEIEDRYEFT